MIGRNAAAALETEQRMVGTLVQRIINYFLEIIFKEKQIRNSGINETLGQL